MATLLKADGTRQEVWPGSGEAFTLEEMQAYVGGLISILDVGEGIMVLNDEGKLEGLPFNRQATRIARPYLFPFDSGIVGDVLIICEEAQMDQAA